MGILEIVAALAFFFLGGPLLIEVVGYAWHRLAEHAGLVGDTVRYRHHLHHDVKYPLNSYKSTVEQGYFDSHSWSWYVLGGVIGVCCIVFLSWTNAIAMITGGLIYGLGVIEYFHRAFHLKGHWLYRFHWFRKLSRLHHLHHLMRCNYGIAFFGMDRLFGTYRTVWHGKLDVQFPGYNSNSLQNSVD
ncbi:MAG: sterol desaturase family protein [Leptospirales bacterium]|nr:sterol desaturase family protein [Leptospirales bacterium]